MDNIREILVEHTDVKKWVNGHVLKALIAIYIGDALLEIAKAISGK